METLSKVMRYALAVIASLYFLFFLVEVGSPGEEIQQAAGRNFGRAVICGAIAAWWFRAARKKQRTPPTRSPGASEFQTQAIKQPPAQGPVNSEVQAEGLSPKEKAELMKVAREIRDKYDEVFARAQQGLFTNQRPQAEVTRRRSIARGGVLLTPEEVAEALAQGIGKSFSAAQFKDDFKGQVFAERWTLDDGLATWYSLGNLQMLIAAWTAYEDRNKVFRILDYCKPRLLEIWNMSGKTFERFRSFVEHSEADFRSFVSCKDGRDLFGFFGRFMNRILGNAETILVGAESLNNPPGDPIKALGICYEFVENCITDKKLLTETPIDWNSPEPAECKAARALEPVSKTDTKIQTPVDSAEVLRAALALHEDLAPFIQGLLQGLEARGLNKENASQEVAALFSNMVDASKEFQPGIATLTVASLVDRWLDELIGQSENEGLSRMASATRQSLFALSKEVANALQEEGWSNEQVTLQVSSLYRKILQISSDCDNYVTNLTIIISLDMYAKQLAEKLISGRPEELSSVGIAYTGDGRSQQTAIFFTGTRTQLEHIGLQHQFIRDKGIALVGARHAVGGEGGHLYDVWPTREGELWFKVPLDPDPTKTRKELEELVKKRQGSPAESGDRPSELRSDCKPGESAPKQPEADDLKQAVSNVLSALEAEGGSVRPRQLDAAGLKQFLGVFSEELEKALSHQSDAHDVHTAQTEAADAEEGRQRANNPEHALLDIEYEQMKICSRCFELRGFWRPKGATETPGSRFRLFWYTQECECDKAVSNLNEEWPAFDFKTAIELCRCCGLEPLRSGSKWSVWFCDDCKEMVRQLHAKYQRYIIPIGCHSFHGGFRVTGEKARDKAEVEYFAIRWKNVSESIDHLSHFAKLAVSENLEKLGFPKNRDVGLVEYLAAIARNPLDKKAAFHRLCGFFEVEP